MKWPYIRQNYKDSVTLNFNISIAEFSKPFYEEQVTIRFEKTLRNCKQGAHEDVSVEPPLEFESGVTYCIIIQVWRKDADGLTAIYLN